MAKFSTPGFTGRIGELIFYNLNGQICVRTVPYKVRQSRATKASASVFGRASALGAVIRKQLAVIIPSSKDNSMQTRLVTTLYQWLLMVEKKESKSNQPVELVGFPFVQQRRSLNERWKVNVTIRVSHPGEIQIRIPAFVPAKSISAPPSTVGVGCRIASCVVDIDSPVCLGSDSTEFIFEYDDKPVAARTISFKCSFPTGSLMITAISLHYKTAGNVAPGKLREFIPAEIVDAQYLG